MFAMGVENEATGDSKCNDSPVNRHNSKTLRGIFDSYFTETQYTDVNFKTFDFFR